MQPTILETGCLVIGSGAMGMASADTLLTGTDATLMRVDRHHRPGGHWNNAYPFGRLQQPSLNCGVDSRLLGRGDKDLSRWNQGLFELASGAAWRRSRTPTPLTKRRMPKRSVPGRAGFRVPVASRVLLSQRGLPRA